MNVSTLCGLLQTKQPAVSHHLKLLHLSGLVEFRRDGKHNYYRLESDLVAGLLHYLATDGNPGNCPRRPRSLSFPVVASKLECRSISRLALGSSIAKLR